MSTEQKHVVLLVPGLHGHTPERVSYFRTAVTPWRKYGLEPRILPLNWGDGEAFRSKLSWLVDEIDMELQEDNKVSMLGASAGGAIVLDAFIRKPQIHRVVTVSSRNNSRSTAMYPSLLDVQKHSTPAAEAVRWLEKHADQLTPEMRMRILNSKALSGDTQVHPSMSHIDGAINVWLPPVRNHIQAVSKALTVHADVIIEFLTK